jgi:hypothetical protein
MGKFNIAEYTERYDAVGGPEHLTIRVRPGADLDSEVLVYCEEDDGFLRLNGWMWSFTKIDNTVPPRVYGVEA